MKSKMKKNNIEDISSVYGKDMEDELTSMLSDELATSIDAQIIKELFANKNRRKSSINKIFSSKN